MEPRQAVRTWSTAAPFQESTKSEYDGSLVFLHNLEKIGETTLILSAV